eukprot:GHRR01028786.1.p2 GENE.GHRR01028786.1~~GHRR01028786.1.p2  ORF type:complete len:108 (+),score=23.54 GHRR01028786.1:124-447(+)
MHVQAYKYDPAGTAMYGPCKSFAVHCKAATGSAMPTVHSWLSASMAAVVYLTADASLLSMVDAWCSHHGMASNDQGWTPYNTPATSWTVYVSGLYGICCECARLCNH